MTKPSFKTIGVFANWFEGTNYEEIADTVKFKPLELLFTPGYLSMEHYVCCINDSFSVFDKDFSFPVPTDLLANVLPKWRDRITLTCSNFSISMHGVIVLFIRTYHILTPIFEC